MNVEKLKSVIPYDWDGFLASGKKSVTIHTGLENHRGAVGVLPLFGQFYVPYADVAAAATFNISINAKNGSTITWVRRQDVGAFGYSFEHDCDRLACGLAEW